MEIYQLEREFMGNGSFEGLNEAMFESALRWLELSDRSRIPWDISYGIEHIMSH